MQPTMEVLAWKTRDAQNWVNLNGIQLRRSKDETTDIFEKIVLGGTL